MAAYRIRMGRARLAGARGQPGDLRRGWTKPLAGAVDDPAEEDVAHRGEARNIECEGAEQTSQQHQRAGAVPEARAVVARAHDQRVAQREVLLRGGLRGDLDLTAEDPNDARVRWRRMRALGPRHEVGAQAGAAQAHAELDVLVLQPQVTPDVAVPAQHLDGEDL